MRHIKLVTRILEGLPSRMGLLWQGCLEVTNAHLHSSLAQVRVKPAAEPVLLVPFGLAMPSEVVRVALPSTHLIMTILKVLPMSRPVVPRHLERPGDCPGSGPRRPPPHTCTCRRCNPAS